MVEGVTKGFEKHLEIQGVGYRAQLKGTDLELAVGFSHPVAIKPRAGISFDVPAPTQIIVKGIDKQAVGQTAAEIRKVRRPSRTRARASATATSRSAGRSGSARERDDETPGAYAPPSPGSGKIAGPRSGLVSQCSARTAASSRSSSTTRAGARCGSGWNSFSSSGSKTEQASAVGKALGQAAKKAGIERCVFDRGGYLYHGRVKALAEGARGRTEILSTRKSPTPVS